MELNAEDQKALTEFETVKKGAKEVEFDKIQIKDLAVK